MKTGLFFGSFNPIHIGHLIIASYMVEFTDLEKLWFVISPQNPLKNKKHLLNEYERLELVRLAIEEDDRFQVSDIEFHLPRPSYTIDTLTYLQEKHPQNVFIPIMGSDSLKTIHKWKNYEELIRQYQFYVYPRPDSPVDEKCFLGVRQVNAPEIQISASFIRSAIKKGKSVKYLLPPKVLEYIDKWALYSD